MQETSASLMTDGVTESFDNHSVSLGSLAAGIAQQDTRSATRICDAIMARAVESHGPNGVEDWTDDRTVVVVAVQ